MKAREEPAPCESCDAEACQHAHTSRRPHAPTRLPPCPPRPAPARPQVTYNDAGMEAVIFTADGDMRQALNNMQVRGGGGRGVGGWGLPYEQTGAVGA